MKLNFTKFLFLMSMTVGVMVSMSSNSWIVIWIGMEMTTISFISTISEKKMMISESSIKYFIIQSMSSMIFMFGIISMIMVLNTKMMITMSMMMKSAIPPFHMWIISMSEGISYNSIALLSTMLKIIPMMIMKMISAKLNLMIIMSLMVGSISGLNQNSMRKMLMFSSIFNMGFLLYSLQSNSTWMNYMITYSLILIMVTINMKKINVNYMNQMIFFNSDPMSKINLWMIMFSLGGIPPMIGFFMKIMILEKLMENNELIISMVMILTSMLTMFFYMSMMTQSMLMFNLKMKWKKNKNLKMSILMIAVNLILSATFMLTKSMT